MKKRLPFLVLALLCLGCPKPDKGSGSSSPVESGLFTDITESTGISFVVTKPPKPLTILETIGHGVGVIDADGDNLPDLIFVGPDQVRFYHNKGNYQFEDRTADSPWRQKGYWCGVAVGDYDNDGKSDIYLCGYDCSALYHNDGNGHFLEVTNNGLEVKKAEYPEWRSSVGFLDYDRDGLLDLYICRYAEFNEKSPQLCGDPKAPEKFSCSPDVYTPQKGSLFRNLGKGRFVEVKNGVETASGRALGLAFGDYNDDGWPDIAVANDERAGDLFENQQGKRFKNRGVESGTAFNPNGHVHGGMGADFADYDGDGKLDLFVTTYQNEAKSLYQNMGSGLFMERGLDSGISERLDKWVSFGVKFLDYDNDTAPDLMVASGHVISNTAKIYEGTQYRQPVQLFHNTGGRFQEVTEQLSPKARELLVGRALATADLNNSGRLDVIVTQNEGAVRILRNNAQTNNHWLTLHLESTSSNRDALGARVSVTAGGKTQFTDLFNCNSYVTANDIRAHFGLGTAATIEKVTVRWPNGKTETFTGSPLEPDHIVRLVEGGTMRVESAAK